MSPAGGRHRLVWLTDAPQSYFAGEMPRGLRLGDEPRLPQAVPASVRRHAARVIEQDSASTRGPARRWRRRSTGWSRGSARSSRAIRRARRARPTRIWRWRKRAAAAIARTRSSITAMAMGIPARYVENELHVFVEVMVPRVGWRRINLGGALVDEQVAGADGKVPYRPQGRRSVSAAAAVRQGQRRHAAGAEGAAGRGERGNGGGSVSRGGGGGGTERRRHERRRHRAAAADRRRRDGGGGSRAWISTRSIAKPPPARPARAPPRPSPRASASRVGARDTFRGDRLDVSGTVATADTKPRGLRSRSTSTAPAARSKSATPSPATPAPGTRPSKSARSAARRSSRRRAHSRRRHAQAQPQPLTPLRRLRVVDDLHSGHDAQHERKHRLDLARWSHRSGIRMPTATPFFRGSPCAIPRSGGVATTPASHANRTVAPLFPRGVISSSPTSNRRAMPRDPARAGPDDATTTMRRDVAHCRRLQPRFPCVPIRAGSSSNRRRSSAAGIARPRDRRIAVTFINLRALRREKPCSARFRY